MTAVNARAQVLAAVRDALRFQPSAAAFDATSAPPPASAAQGHADHEALSRSFCSELETLGGSARIVGDLKTCAADIQETMQRRSLRSIAVQSSPLALAVAGCLRDCDIAAAADLPKSDLAAIDCSLLEARALLADSGSAVVLAHGTGDRMLSYLPPTCFIVCDAAHVHAGMDEAALACISDAAQTGMRGEALIVTGPSRTADIEKILVLGAHGPAFVRAFIVERTQPA